MGAQVIQFPLFGTPPRKVVSRALMGGNIRGNILEVRLVDDIDRGDAVTQKAIIETIKKAVECATRNQCEIFRFWSDCTLRGDEAAALARFRGREIRLEDLWRIYEPGVLAEFNAFQGKKLGIFGFKDLQDAERLDELKPFRTRGGKVIDISS